MVAPLKISDIKVVIDKATMDTAYDKYERKVLTRTGAFSRRVMRNSIRRKPKRKAYTPIPPYPRYQANSSSGLRLIIFVYDKIKGTITVGPVKFKSSQRRRFKNRTETWSYSKTSVPQLLNEGGTVNVDQMYKSGRSYFKTYRFRAFPFVNEALEISVKRMKEIIEQEELKK